MSDLDVAIVGAGIGGLAAAVALTRRGVNVQVYEQARKLGEVGAGVQIAPNATRVLIQLGLEEQCRAVAAQPAFFDLCRWKDDEVITSSEMGKTVETAFAAPYLTFHRHDLHGLLAAQVPAERIHVNHRLTEIREDGDRPTLVFENGSEVSASVIVGADGLNSTVRRMVVSDEAVYSGESVYRGLVPRERAQEFLSNNHHTLWIGPGMHLVAYPIRRGELVNWGLAMPAPTERPESWETEGSVDEVLKALDGWCDRTHALVSQSTRAFAMPVFDRKPINNLSHGSMTLLGDAAHPMLPYMAQGAGQSIEDAWVLADCLVDLSDRPVAERLHLYEEIRTDRTQQVQLRSRANGETFHLEDGPAQRSRDAALKDGGLTPSTFEWLYGYDATKATAEAAARSATNA